MHTSKLHNLFGIVMVALCMGVFPLQSNAASQGRQKISEPEKDRLVLMPLRDDAEEDKSLLGAMETALVEGLQQKYVVFSGEQVAQVAHQIYMKETHAALDAHKECDATRCLQNIGVAFQSELIAVASVTKKDGGYFLALSIQNIFDNKVEFSKTMTCEGCNAFKVVDKLKILSGVVANNSNDIANEEPRRKSIQPQVTTFPTLEQAQSEINKLHEKIAAIEDSYEKELANTRKQVKQRYSDKLEALDKEQRDEFDTASGFKAQQDKNRSELIRQRDIELARLDVTRDTEIATAPLKARIKALMEHIYIVGAEGIEAVLAPYDADAQQFGIKLQSKNSALKLKLNGNITLQNADAKTFKQQWQAGLVRPEAKAKFNGEWLDIVLVNDADGSRLMNRTGSFITEMQALTGIMLAIPGKNFEMGKFDVTQAQWQAVMGNNPSRFTNCGVTCPVEQVSWDDVQEFLQKLNAKTGRQFRLPTEEEWEYACYGGNHTEYCGASNLDSIAWYKSNSDSTTHPVGQKQANGYGLYDMSGNVWQWMENTYDDGHEWRALRGGSWEDDTYYLRAAHRSSNVPTIRLYDNGFRLARTLP